MKLFSTNWKALIILIGLSIMACRVPHPPYKLDVLQGNWERTWSTDYRSDSMRLSIQNDSAVVIFVPMTSNFVVGSKKWTALTSIAEGGDFELYDWGSRDKSWRANIKMLSDTSFELKHRDYPDAPGGIQRWVKIP